MPSEKRWYYIIKGILYGKANKMNEAQASYLKAIEEVEKQKTINYTLIYIAI